MEAMLSVKEVADLKGCSPQWIRKLATTGKLDGQKTVNADGSPEWVFPISVLPPHVQQTFFEMRKLPAAKKAAAALAPIRATIPMDCYSADEREEIAFWLRLVEEWQG